ncbi:MAG: SDR family oxidoreductase [Streptomycetaceae bacterium]|nr:MAG: SDR family oxidoreductase [Streptomycetaceae bacterium]
MAYSFAGKVFVITGGAGGVGSHLAREFAGKGAHLVLISRNDKKLAEVIAGLSGEGHMYIACDLTDRNEIKKAITVIEKKYGHIDVLIPNAAITSTERFDVRSIESIERELDINLVAPLVFIRSAIPLLKKAIDPRIITTGSLGGIFPLGETPMYTASKFGLRGAMLSMSLDLASKGIKAGSVLPSATDTPMLHKEAIEGGNSLQFMDPPQSTQDVVKSFYKMLNKPRFEIYPRNSESWLVKIALLIPNQLPRLMPLFRGSGEKGHKKYLKELEKRGIARKVGDGWEYIE